MGLMDDLLKQSGGLGALASLAAKNPQLLAAGLALLNSKDTSVGGATGLAEIVGSLQKGGLGDVVASWISTGENQSVSPSQLSTALGADVLKQFAGKAGIDGSEAPNVLAEILPALVSHLTPQGNVPESSSLESALGGLLSSFGR
jgi:uncharacterized protein YidB (DUF937 family)